MPQNRSPVVIDCIRTPVGRSHDKRGAFRNVRSDDLGVAVVRALLERTGIDPAEIDDVVLGAAQHYGEQGFNAARFVALAAGIPCTVPAATINRLCASSLQALQQATHAIMAGCADVVIAGGFEHMHHLPIDTGWDVHPKFMEVWGEDALSMGTATDLLASNRGITRQQQDAYALESHQKAAAAQEAGAFQAEIVPVMTRGRKNVEMLVEKDQCIRADTSLERLAELQPAFLPVEGTVTAGNASPLSDGAAALLIMSEAKARALGFRPLVRIAATAAVGVDPLEFGLGPVPATQVALERAGMTLQDIDLVEINEAFAAQVLACLREMPVAVERLNVRGGALAIGHPLGASGARISTTLIRAMVDRGAATGLATMCVGHGQGMAAVFERTD